MISVLVVEENYRMRELLMNVLADAGYSVDEAPNGRAAVERAREHRPEIVVLSRDTYARELLSARATDPMLAGMKVVVASSRPRPLQGVAVYLKYPFTMDDLLAALHRCLERGERQVSPRSAAWGATHVEQPGTDAT
jgi:CheY-like chemotaxis protein